MSAATSSSDLSPTAYEARLAHDLPGLLPNHPSVVRILPISTPGGFHPNVRRIALSTGETVIAKRHLFAPLTAGQSYHLLSVEQAASDLLLREACPVPNLLATIGDLGVVILSDVGSETLDDVVQTRPIAESSRVAVAAVDAFARIQEVLIQQDQLTDEMFAPGCDADSVRDRFTGLPDAIDIDALKFLVVPNAEIDRVMDQLRRLISSLAKQPVYPGPTDYNARNIVIDDARSPHFLEWSKLGYDWPERRAIQYLTSLGASRPGGRPRSLVDTWIADRYSSAASWSTPAVAAFTLDGHHLVFHVLLGMRWMMGGERLSGSMRAALTTPLSPSPVVGGIRKQFREVI